ncbi:tRNA pseudouridine(38-40) synthase TruA [Corynebacterium rhinophilum]|uniref:tRNA pseudouridine(38-40) synthase TruA n=1 Tax=Corynebacterium rhinophilum TaxID=3050197 RepID=UPI00254DCE55|nr:MULTISPECIES: tRNA pseudouridine(38-40) synthase TruA [unclassified Corynebacterium]MDK8466210.1 tRNA pseudouridine(38-40) synthase TruA [Corynebacterium sp. MSK130]MDK8686914.1 tRNA pseudouridine(38-40) synthase TruA [Corynebacterium sp. MSK122]MDK8765371.1 tRNA pseudouridine(38-40) synthase TruA [Corynebacterium sp. MSK293]
MTEAAAIADEGPAEGFVRLRLDLAYDGTDFHGWARQKGGLRTVQGVLEEQLAMIARTEVPLTVAGRTDAGVHARGQVAHVDVPQEMLEQRSVANDPGKLVRRLAKLLPEDVRVHGCEFAPDSFDARFSALRRHYVYRITTSQRGALPTRAHDTAEWFKPIDIDAMQDAANVLVGLHDFAAFCKAKPNATTIRELQEFSWRDVSTQEEPQLFEARVTADAFCWSMVRSLVGCCLSVGEGRRNVDFAAALLQETKRSSRIPVAPAKGLSLVQVDYPEPSEMSARADVTREKRTVL